jgi:hypothetical protein
MLDLLDHLVRVHLRQRFVQRGESVAGDVFVDVVESGPAAVFQDDFMLTAEKSRYRQVFDDLTGFRIDVAELTGDLAVHEMTRDNVRDVLGLSRQ